MSDTILAATPVFEPAATAAAVALPIVLDLDGNGVTTVSLSKSKAHYDLDGDGIADRTAWIGATEGFLFLDRDGNGTVTNAAEFSFIGDLAGAKTDLEGLRFFDSNNDGVFSALDARFSDFRVWQDKDGDGVAETGEILSLATAGVRSINLTGTLGVTAAKRGDVTIYNTGTYTRINGSAMAFVDVGLAFASTLRDGLPQIEFTPQAYDLKSKKYRITAKDGGLFVTLKHGIATIDSRAGGLGGSFDLTFRNFHVGMLTPLVLDLDGDGVSLIYRDKSRVRFDMNGDGALDKSGWISRRDGFLVVDRNGNGLIDDGSELSLLAEDPTARSSLDALATFDSNSDRVVDANDARFGELRIWIDANGNGVTDTGELKTLAEAGIAAVSLDAHFVTSSAKLGNNMVLSTATFTRTNGLVGTLGNVALAFEPGAKPVVVALPGNVIEPIVLPIDPQDPAAVTGASSVKFANFDWIREPFAKSVNSVASVESGDAAIIASAAQMASAMASFGAPSMTADLLASRPDDSNQTFAVGTVGTQL
jgi:hypothetical protein